MAEPGTREDYVARYGDDLGNRIADEINLIGGVSRPDKSNTLAEVDTTAALVEIAKLRREGSPEPKLEPDFNPMAPNQYVTYTLGQGATINEDAPLNESIHQQLRPLYYNAGRVPAFDIGAPAFPPDIREHVRPLEDSQAYLDVVKELEANGMTFERMDQTSEWLTSIELAVALQTGVSPDARTAYEAHYALWEDQQAGLAEYNRELDANSARLERNEFWNQIVRDWGPKLGSDYLDSMVYVHARYMDEHRLNQLMARTIQNLSDNYDEILANDNSRREFVNWFAMESGKLSQDFLIETGELEPNPPPGLRDVWNATVGSFAGIGDILLPEELFGADLRGGSIIGGPQTALGFAAGQPGVSNVLNGLGRLWEPIDREFTKPFMQGVSDIFAGTSPLAWGEQTPYREYLTMGQNLGVSLGMDYGTDEFVNFTGAVDMLGYIVADPIFIIAPLTKSLSLAARVPIGAGKLAARSAETGKVLTRNQLVNRAYLPYVGRAALPMGTKGMKGPLTRGLYMRFAKTAEELSRTSKANKLWEELYRVGQAGGVGQLTDRFKELERAPNLANAIANVAENAEDVRQMWVHALTSGETLGPKLKGQLEAMHSRAVENLATEVQNGLRGGLIGAQTVKGVRLGKYKWDGHWGYVQNADGSYARRLLKGTGDEVKVFIEGGKIADMNILRQLAQRADAPWILRNVVGTLDEAVSRAKGAKQAAINMVDNLAANLSRSAPVHVVDDAKRAQFEALHAAVDQAAAKVDAISSQPSYLRSVMRRAEDELIRARDELRRFQASLQPEDFRGTPLPTAAGARALGEREFVEVLLEYVERMGYDGLQFNKYNYFTNSGTKKLISARDLKKGDEILASGRAKISDIEKQLGRLTREQDDLSWIIDLPIKTTTAKVGGLTRDAIRSKFYQVTSQEFQRATRMRIAKFTRVAENFPQGVVMDDTKTGITQIRQIGERVGISPEQINDMINRYASATFDERYHVLGDIRAEMVAETKHWRYQHGIDGFFIDEGEFKGGKTLEGEDIARVDSRSRPGNAVASMYEPSMRAHIMPFFREDFYKELDRLRRARRLAAIPFGSNIVEGFGLLGRGARKRRADIVERWRKMMEDKGVNMSAFEEADIYNMAYASMVEGANGMGMISRAGAKVSRVNRLIHSQFSIQALALRASSWMAKVAIVEEPIRSALGGIINGFANPPRALMDVYGTLVVRKVQRDAALLSDITPIARQRVRSQVAAQLEDASLASGKDILTAARDLLGEDVRTFLARNVGEELTEREAWAAVDAFVNKAISDADLTVGGRVSGYTEEIDAYVRNVERIKNQRLSKLAFDEGEMKLDDILNIGFGAAYDEVGMSIFQNTMFDEFIGMVDRSRDYVSVGRSNRARRNYAAAKAGDLIREANDPYARIAVSRWLAEIKGGKAESIRSIITRSRWKQMSGQIRRIADEMVPERNLSSQAALATWYFDEFMRNRVIIPKFQFLWVDDASGLHDVDRMINVLQGVMDRRIDDSLSGITIPLRKDTEKVALDRIDNVIRRGYDQGSQWKYLEQVVGDVTPAAIFSGEGRNWSAFDLQHTFNTPFRKVIEYAGARASEAISRQPGWRRVFADYKRHYERLGWSPERANAAAQIQATKTINTLFYNAREMNNFLKKFNSVVPFGAAMYEVMDVWMRQLPKDNIANGGLGGWVVGSVALQRKFNYLVQGLEALGLIQRDDNGRPVITFDTEGRWAQQVGAHIFGAPQNLVSRIAQFVDVDLPPLRKLEFQLGTPFTPFNPDNNGLLAVSNFSIGLTPPAAFAMNVAFGSALGSKGKIEFEGGTLADLLTEHDIEAHEFFSEPRNRMKLRELGVDPKLFAEIANSEAEIEIAVLLENLGLDTEIPAAEFVVPVSGPLRDFAANYIFPYGVPSGLGEVVYNYVPSSTQGILRAAELAIFDGDSPVSDWFLGPVSAYRTEGAIVEGIMVGEVQNGYLSQFTALHAEASKIRQRALDEGLFFMDNAVESPGFEDRFAPVVDVYGEDANRQAEIAQQLQDLAEEIADLEEAMIEDGVNYAIAANLGRAFTQLAMPISPQTYTADEEKVRQFWGSREFADALFPDRLPDGTFEAFDPKAREAAYTRWLNLVDEGGMEQMAQMVKAFLTPYKWTPNDEGDFWGLAPSSDVKRQFLEQPGNAHLHFFLTPSKLYPKGYVRAEDVGEFFERVGAGEIEFADPHVFMMRAWTSKVNDDQAAERQAFLEENGGNFTAFTDNWHDWARVLEEQKNQRDYLDFVDDMFFDGAYNKAREEATEINSAKPDAAQIIRDAKLTQRRRTQSILRRLIEDVDSYAGLDPEDVKEFKSALFGLESLTDELASIGEELDRFNARTDAERDLDMWFDAVINPHAQHLERLYDIADKIDNKYDRGIWFDNIRYYENNVYMSTPTIRGVRAPNPYEFRIRNLLAQVEENGGDPKGTRLEAAALKQMSAKPEWLSMSDIDVIAEYALALGAPEENVRAMFPTTNAEWSIYSTRNRVYNEIDRLRIAGEITDYEANKAKDEVDVKFISDLEEMGRATEAAQFTMTPAQRLFHIGILPRSLEKPLEWAESFIEQRAAMRASGTTGIDTLWRTEYAPLILDYLNNNAGAKQAFRDLGGYMFGESNDLMTIMQKLLLGDFGPV